MPERIIPIKTYAQTWAALLVLLLVTVGAAYVPLGPLNTFVALAIAALKAVLIGVVFMHLRWSAKLLHLAAIAGLLWLSILISFVVLDYMTRHWIPYQGR